MLNNFGPINVEQLKRYLEALKLIVEHGGEAKEFAEELLPHLPELLKGEYTAKHRGITLDAEAAFSEIVASMQNKSNAAQLSAAQPSAAEVLETILKRDSDQWVAWRNSLPGSANPELPEETALAFAGSVERSAGASKFLVPQPGMPEPTKEQRQALQEKAHGIPESVVLQSVLNTLWDRHAMRDLPPQIQVGNLIQFRNGLRRLGASSSLIRNLNIEIGRLAHAYREYWLTH